MILVNRLGELVDGGGHLQSLEQDALLALDADVLGPLDEASEVALGLDVASNSIVAGVLLKQGGVVLLAATLGAATGHHNLFALGYLLNLLSVSSLPREGLALPSLCIFYLIIIRPIY